MSRAGHLTLIIMVEQCVLWGNYQGWLQDMVARHGCKTGRDVGCWHVHTAELADCMSVRYIYDSNNTVVLLLYAYDSNMIAIIL